MKPINELLKLHEEWLDEVYDRLWYEYFTPAEDISDGLKKFIREQLNYVADMHNKAFTAETMQLKKLTAKDTWENDGNGPLSDRKLYVSCKPAVVVPPAKKKAKAKVEEDDEDLMGEVKPAKKKAAPKAAAGGKGKYEQIAELAAKGMNKDQIQEATGFERKTVTDLLWRWNKLNPKK